MAASYEEVRSAVVDLLAGREQGSYGMGQMESLQIGVQEVLDKRNRAPQTHRAQLNNQTRDHVHEVFWDLFRQGVIIPGSDSQNSELPFFRVSSYGRKVLANQDTYFFHDVSTYLDQLRQAAPAIDDLTLLYAGEAMQAYRAGCMLAASVMLGVATEHEFELILDAANGSAVWSGRFKNAAKEIGLLRRFSKFKATLEQHLKDLPADVRDDIDPSLAGVLSIIRVYRNDSGHPTGKIVQREQMYVLLNLFPHYCKKVYAIRNSF